VLVSGAAGATGSIVGQLAKLGGAGRVVGIVGSEEKRRWVTEDLGFDDAINYKAEPIGAALAAKLPDGVDLYWDNVGGEILDTCLEHLAMRGRVVLCGSISRYNDQGEPIGLRNYMNLLNRRGRMEGFIVSDFVDRYPEAEASLGKWVSQGLIKTQEFVIKGLDQAPEALNLLLDGKNIGKTLVEL
jgi:NADPH-dependent curcumin reductase CurA